MERDVQASDGLLRLAGSIEGVIYANAENGYAILDFGTAENELVTIVGTMPYVSEGEELTVFGKWVHNPKYGRQFQVEQFEKKLPSDEAAILRYLSSGAIKGLGAKRAARIVEQFGEDSFDVIENHPHWLAEVQGISRRMAEEISEEFRRQAGVRAAMMFFRDYFGAAVTVRIYNAWGAGAVERAKHNPYALCHEIEGIGFERVDSMAAELGFDKNSIERIKSGVLHTLSYNAVQYGHTCLPQEMLREAAAALLEVDAALVDEAIAVLIKEGRVRRIHTSTRAGRETLVYDYAMYRAECMIAERLILLDRTCVLLDMKDTNAFIAREERLGGIAYAALQKQAIANALENGVTVLTGGPGTGKTTVVRALLRIFDSMGLRVALCAPTGRAAKRLSESTSAEAKTVHRLLEMSYNGHGKAEFGRNERNLLEEDVVIVDECSMLDVPLAAALLSAVKSGARLVLIGDADQLPSVGAGNVLHDIIASRRFATVGLTEIFRQAENSLIVTNAHAINRGEMPVLDVKNNDFFYLPRTGDRDIAATVADLCGSRLPRAYGAAIAGGVQVICPSRKGEAGTENLNRLLQLTLNPPAHYKREKQVRELVFREGDRVMQIKNNYDLTWERGDEIGYGVFNGDIGVIESIDTKDKSISVVFEDRHVTYDFTGLDELEHAFAVTVHKSQGCEYPVVILPLGSTAPMLQTRNLFYTAVTRAQRMVILVGERHVAERMVANNREAMRYTGLAARFLAGNGEA